MCGATSAMSSPWILSQQRTVTVVGPLQDWWCSVEERDRANPTIFKLIKISSLVCDQSTRYLRPARGGGVSIKSRTQPVRGRRGTGRTRASSQVIGSTWRHRVSRSGEMLDGLPSITDPCGSLACCVGYSRTCGGSLELCICPSPTISSSMHSSCPLCAL